MVYLVHPRPSYGSKELPKKSVALDTLQTTISIINFSKKGEWQYQGNLKDTSRYEKPLTNMHLSILLNCITFVPILTIFTFWQLISIFTKCSITRTLLLLFTFAFFRLSFLVFFLRFRNINNLRGTTINTEPIFVPKGSTTILTVFICQ